jgi:hypothetical protein
MHLPSLPLPAFYLSLYNLLQYSSIDTVSWLQRKTAEAVGDFRKTPIYIVGMLLDLPLGWGLKYLSCFSTNVNQAKCW